MKIFRAIILSLFGTISILALSDDVSNTYSTEPTLSGPCPEVGTKADFQYEKFAGDWFEIKRFPNALVSEDCALATFTNLPYNNYNITYLSRDLEKSKVIKRELVIDKEVINGAELKYDVYSKCRKDSFQHYILDTDYDTYAVIWGCNYKNQRQEHAQRLFIYSKERILDADAQSKIKNLLESNKIKYEKLEDVDQDEEKCDLGDQSIWNKCPQDICKDYECVVQTK